MARGWYVIQVNTGFEKKVYKDLEAKKNQDVLRNVLLNVRLPEEDYVVERKGKKIEKKRLLYPGYVLVELDIPEDEVEWKEVYTAIRSINGVNMFLSSGGGNKRPKPLSYDEVKQIFEQTGEIKSLSGKLESVYSVGDRVKVMEGAFAGFEGEVLEVINDKNMLAVSVEIFGRLVRLELEYTQVQKIG